MIVKSVNLFDVRKMRGNIRKKKFGKKVLK